MSKKNEEKEAAVQTIRMSLEVRLTEQELKKCSKTLAEAIRARDQANAEMETFRIQKKAQITQLEGLIQEQSSLINSEKEYRQVECEIRVDWDKGIKIIVRKDTGEIVRREPVTNEERQMHLSTVASDLRE